MLATPVGFRQEFLAHIAMIACSSCLKRLPCAVGDVEGSRLFSLVYLVTPTTDALIIFDTKHDQLVRGSAHSDGPRKKLEDIDVIEKRLEKGEMSLACKGH